MSRAEKAIQAAASPESDESATAAVGITGARIADPSPHPSSTGIAGSASALAGTVQSGIVPNSSQRMGAVTMPQADAVPIRLLHGWRPSQALARSLPVSVRRLLGRQRSLC